MKNNIFKAETVSQISNRIDNLTHESKAAWGKMSVSQMLARCNVTYEMAFENKHKKPNVFLRFLLKSLVKKKVVSSGPYQKKWKNSTTVYDDRSA